MQELIVYRNPMEAALWHTISQNPSIIFIFGGVMLVAWLALWFGLTGITGKGKWRNDGGGWIMPVTFIGSFIAACIAVWFWA
jgi:hypothetical protein